jgi:hypothetical protein
VKVTLPRSGNLWKVAGVTSATITSLVPAIGVIIKKLSPTVCFVQFHGTAPFTVYSGLTPGRIYVVGTDGQPATQGDANYPVSGGPDAFQQIGVATSNDELFIQPLDSFEGQPSPPGGSRLFQQTLSGPQDGLNLVFTTALKFIASGPARESFFVNGVLQLQGAGNDYVVSESGGPGTGYDTITMAYPPLSFDRLSVDFAPS